MGAADRCSDHGTNIFYSGDNDHLDSIAGDEKEKVLYSKAEQNKAQYSREYLKIACVDDCFQNYSVSSSFCRSLSLSLS